MRFTGRLVCLSLAILALSLVTAPLTKVGVECFQEAFPKSIPLFGFDSTNPSYDFGRTYRRLLMVLALVLGYLARRWLGPLALKGLDRRIHPGRYLGSGLLLGVLSFSLFLGILIVLGERSLAPEAPVDWPRRVGLALSAGLLVGVIEETIFRGVLLGGLLQERSQFAAVVLSSALFSVAHFLQGNVPVTSGLDLGVGLRALLAHFHPVTEPTNVYPFIGLFLVGLVLGYAYLWANSLPFAIGLHAGWVFLSKIDGFFLQEQAGIAWLYGKHGILAGALGWVFLLIMLPLLRLWIHLPPVLMKPRRT